MWQLLVDYYLVCFCGSSCQYLLYFSDESFPPRWPCSVADSESARGSHINLLVTCDDLSSVPPGCSVIMVVPCQFPPCNRVPLGVYCAGMWAFVCLLCLSSRQVGKALVSLSDIEHC